MSAGPCRFAGFSVLALKNYDYGAQRFLQGGIPNQKCHDETGLF